VRVGLSRLQKCQPPLPSRRWSADRDFASELRIVGGGTGPGTWAAMPSLQIRVCLQRIRSRTRKQRRQPVARAHGGAVRLDVVLWWCESGRGVPRQGELAERREGRGAQGPRGVLDIAAKGCKAKHRGLP
jgi:hypothetical protein